MGAIRLIRGLMTLGSSSRQKPTVGKATNRGYPAQPQAPPPAGGVPERAFMAARRP